MSGKKKNTGHRDEAVSFREARARAEAALNGEELREDGQTSSEQTSSEQTSSEQTSSEQSPAEQSPTEQTPSEQSTTEQTSSEQTSSEQTSSEQTPSEQTPSEQTEEQPEPDGEGESPGADIGSDAGSGELEEKYRQKLMENQRLRRLVSELYSRAREESSARTPAPEAAAAEEGESDADFDALRERILSGSREESAAGLKAIVERAAESGYERAMERLKPVIEQFDAQAREREDDEILSRLEKLPEMSDIRSSYGELRSLGDTYFSGSDPSERMVQAYVYKRGLDAINSPAAPELTINDAVSMYKSDPALRKAIEELRFAEAREAEESAAPVYTSSGIANAAPTMPKRPRTFEEASAAARKLLNGGRR